MKVKLASHVTLAAVAITALVTLSNAARAEDAPRGLPHGKTPYVTGTTTMMEEPAATAAPAPVKPSVKAPARGVVNVNTATVEQLAYLPGVGPKTAQAIIAARPYATAADIERAKGIGPKKAAALAPFVVVSGKTTATEKIKGGAK